MPRIKAEEDGGRRDPFSPREVGRITREFYEDLKKHDRKSAQYNGSKLGHQFELRYNPLKKLLWWRVCIDRKWIEGTDTDVYQAIHSIGHKIANKALDKRMARMLAEPVA